MPSPRPRLISRKIPKGTIVIEIDAGTHSLAAPEIDARKDRGDKGIIELSGIKPGPQGRLIFLGAGIDKTTLIFDPSAHQIFGRDVHRVTFKGLHMTRKDYTVSQGHVVAAASTKSASRAASWIAPRRSTARCLACPPPMAGRRSVSGLDIAATALVCAGQRPATELDGVNLLPRLTGEVNEPPHKTLYWRWVDQGAIQEYPYKLILLGRNKPLLFDITKPEGEDHTQGLSAKHPEIASRLRVKLDAWMAPLTPPGPPKPLDLPRRAGGDWQADARRHTMNDRTLE